MVALLFDVHGNLAALEAVLADAERAGAERFVLGGDLVAFGPQPAATLDRLRDLGNAATAIRGNTERWMADPSEAPAPMDEAAGAGAEAIGDAAVAELAALPESARLDDDTVAWHASFGSDMVPLSPEQEDGEQERLDPQARRIVVGHIHVQFLRERPDGGVVCNPGSVGVPLDGDPRAAYALLEPGGPIELRRVAYDHRGAAAALREAFSGPWVDVVAGRIAEARP